ncbi:MAG: amidohydrolase family protein [Bacillota bacterium]|nr:amidohydrolase family protein [Bacillota bacterium]
MTKQIIDIHSHFLTPEYLTMLDQHQALLEDGFPLPQYNHQDHLKLMKDCSIEWTLLSISSPHPYFKESEEESLKMCRHLNEKMAQLKKDDPKHFGFQACLPLPNVDAAIQEAIYTLDILKAEGINFPSNSRGLYLGDPKLEPLMEELNKRHALCNIHPHRPEPINEDVFTAGPVPLFEFIADTTRAILNLIGNDVILRYPNITWIIPHCGSFLPNIYERFIGMSKILIPQKMMKEVDVEASFKKLYFDIAGNPAPQLLKWLLTITTPDHIMYGSDFPFTPAKQIETNLETLVKMLDEEDLKSYKEMILFKNAQQLFFKSDSK